MKRVFILSLCLLWAHLSSQAQYSLSNAFPNLPTFSLPIEVLQVPDGRWFFVQQRGLIFVVANDSTSNQRKTFLNLSSIVSQSGSETGLLGLAFHPNYSSNRYFYVSYTRSISGQLTSIVSRFTTSSTNPDSALPNSELVLISESQPFSNHNGGQILFGPDGFLYISLGDGGSGGDPGNRAQNRTLALGKILRINVDATSGGLNYAIPASNPYFQNSNGWRQEIFAWGLRNVWKFNFDLPTGRIWAADVGQNIWEEISIIRSGENYGWRLMEGNACYNPTSNCNNGTLTLPVWVYNHSNSDVSITGGFVYRGSAIPALIGRYVYGDFASGRVWALQYDSINPTTNSLLISSNKNISGFAQGINGELYLISYGEGRLFRINGPAGVSGIKPLNSEIGSLDIFPNPAKDQIQIRFDLIKAQKIKLSLLDLQGREVQQHSEQFRQAGKQQIPWALDSTLRPGVYYLRFSAGKEKVIRKIWIEP
jgi:glucose/arabinose dehydrogenase